MDFVAYFFPAPADAGSGFQRLPVRLLRRRLEAVSKQRLLIAHPLTLAHIPDCFHTASHLLSLNPVSFVVSGLFSGSMVSVVRAV
ncbi:hypothetical protein FRC12_022361 [Ceratobasidium sp. 428]|nr:hypothetical protein FRC12_022361 [Ceratobasidium sp. 428]